MVLAQTSQWQTRTQIHRVPLLWRLSRALEAPSWAIESFFKPTKHRFGLHCFGQSTKRGVYRWLVLSLIADLLPHWMVQAASLPQLDWKIACDLALSGLFASVLWFRLLRQLQYSVVLAAQYGFEIILKALPNLAYRQWCKI
ncbi:hypothetical protein [Phormidesmis sp. 146-33]